MGEFGPDVNLNKILDDQLYGMPFETESSGTVSEDTMTPIKETDLNQQEIAQLRIDAKLAGIVIPENENDIQEWVRNWRNDASSYTD